MQFHEVGAKLRRGGIFSIVEIVAQLVHGIDRSQQRMRLEILGGQLVPFVVVMWVAIGNIWSSERECQMSDRFGSRTHFDLDVVAEAIQAVHQLQVGEVAVHHARHLWLRNTHAFGRLLLSQPKGAHGLPDLDHQAGLDLEFFGIGQSQVGKDVARAALNLDVSISALFLPAISMSFCQSY